MIERSPSLVVPFCFDCLACVSSQHDQVSAKGKLIAERLAKQREEEERFRALEEAEAKRVAELEAAEEAERKRKEEEKERRKQKQRED